MQSRLTKRLWVYVQVARRVRAETGSGRRALGNLFFEIWADTLSTGRRFGTRDATKAEAERCSHDRTVRIRRLPREIVRCRRCGVAFATVRDPVDRAEERHSREYFLANKDFIYADGKPDLFTYMMPRTLFLWALGFCGYRPAVPRALDVGCGVGILPRYLQFLGYEAHGVEISPWAVEYAHRELDQQLVRQGTVQSAAYPDEHFGLVTVVHVLEHLDNPAPMLREVFRVLASGGYLYVEVPSSDRDINDYLIDDHFWFYTCGSLRLLLLAQGFEEVRVAEATFEKRLHNVPFIFASARKPR